jgi:tetratricopeptide (TPR) repeat protein
MSVARDLAQLESAQLIQAVEVDPETEYLFRHALLQEAAYELLLRSERQELHAHVGRALEQLFPERSDELAPVLAYHFERANELEPAVRYLASAGLQAVRRFANREARDLLDRAAAHIDDLGDGPDLRLRVEVGLGRAQAGFSFVPFDQTLALLEKTLADAEELDDPRLLASVHLEIARVRGGRGESYTMSQGLQASLDAALQLGEQLGDDGIRAEPLALIGAARLNGGAYAEAIERFGEALPIMESRNDCKSAALAAGNLARAHARVGDFAAASDAADRATELARRCGDPNVILDIVIFRGIVTAEQGLLTEALELTREGVVLADDVGNTYCSLVGNFYAGDQLLRLGDPRAALDSLERSNDLAAFCDAGSVLSLSGAWISAARSMSGADEVDAFAVPLRHAEVIRDDYDGALIRQLRAGARMRLTPPDVAHAVEDLEAASERFDRLGARPALARALAQLGRALDVAGDTEAAGRATRRAEELAEAIDLRLEPAPF